MHEPISPIRALWLTENYHPGRGGMAQSCDRIVHGLRGDGVTIDLVHFTRHLAEPRIEAKQGGRYISFPIDDDPAHGLNLLWNLLAADSFRNHFTHVVAFGGILPLQAGPVYAAWLGVPLITLFRGNDFDAAIFTPKRSDLVLTAIARSSAVAAVSRDKEMKIRALSPATRTVWIPNGIDLTNWEPLPSDRARALAWRREHVQPGRRVLGMIGQIKRKKGGLFFLDALLASGLAGRFHLLFVGDLDDEVLAWLEAHPGAIDQSAFPFADRYELLAHYPACDFAVIGSFYDGLPNVLLEAAALGIPFIASTAGGMADLLIDGEHGFLFHPGNGAECRRAIARAANADDAELARIGERCRELVPGRFDHITEAAAYRGLLAETARSRRADPVAGQLVAGQLSRAEVILPRELSTSFPEES
ncbi:MAG: glycosyltransferase family 4 protein [Candidatus Kapaibacterium sp.]